MQRTVGLREVAEYAGVSLATVSNVLNKPGRVSAATVDRVHQAMAALGFVRNDLARQLRTGDTRTIGMVVLSISNPFFADLSHACEIAAEALDYTVILGSSDQLDERQERYLDLFEQQRVSGVIAVPVGSRSPGLRRLKDRGFPVVVLGTSADAEFCSVEMDGEAGGYLATRHLIEGGRARIGFVGGPSVQVEDRWRGSMRACAEQSGVRLERWESIDTSYAAGAVIGRKIAALDPRDRPDALFAANDLLALGMLQALTHEGRVDVPNEIAIVGYDDVEYSEVTSVPLTTIRQPVQAIGDRALALLRAEALELPTGEHSHQNVLLPPELVVRESSG